MNQQEIIIELVRRVEQFQAYNTEWKNRLLDSMPDVFGGFKKLLFQFITLASALLGGTATIFLNSNKINSVPGICFALIIFASLVCYALLKLKTLVEDEINNLTVQLNLVTQLSGDYPEELFKEVAENRMNLNDAISKYEAWMNEKTKILKDNPPKENSGDHTLGIMLGIFVFGVIILLLSILPLKALLDWLSALCVFSKA